MWLDRQRKGIEKMRITPALLKELGFEQEKNRNGILIDEWRMKMHGYLFTVKGGPPNYDFFSPGQCYSHSVSDVEEIFAFLYEDGYESGREAFKEDFRGFIGVDKKR